MRDVSVLASWLPGRPMPTGRAALMHVAMMRMGKVLRNRLVRAGRDPDECLRLSGLKTARPVVTPPRKLKPQTD